mmetsp:Transcript_14152/g.34028  ORF Transcript_14152/g.34028 Transcript_14152/m.34028 type:complete len:1117 (-) Transcript_14152:229-3579(-)
MSFVASTNKVAAIRLCRSTLGGGARKVVVPSAAVMPVAASSSSASSAGASAALWAQGRSTPKGTIRALAARPIPRRQVIIGGGVAGLATTAVMGSGGYAVNAAVNAAAAAVEAPVNAAMLRPAVAAISALKVGMKLADGKFEVMSVEEVPEYNVACVELLHLKTGARWMHCGADDPNNVFNVAFRTTPTDSSGVAHILEHTALCGSERYPIRDPFFNMLRRSLSTFMNAMTSADYTCYPFATMNPQDYTNLLGVYLDAAFFPKLSREDFLQEGHRLEFAKLDDPTSDLMIKGVVFNEMKGVYSSPDSVLARECQQALFPDTTYGVDSGGDPRVIPELGFQEFKDFHGKFYHPSNSRMFFYGDDDVEERLKVLDGFLGEFERKQVDSSIAAQPFFTEPKRVVASYASGEGEESQKSFVQVNWLLTDNGPFDAETALAVGFLDNLLLGSPAAPLRMALEESGLGEAMVGYGLEDEMFQPTFAIGLKGVEKKDIPAVEKLIFDTIEQIATDGFTQAAIDSSVNTIEFSMRENNTGRFPRGLSLMLRSLSTWLYEMDPIEPLRYEQPLAHLKQRMATEDVFRPLLKRLLLDNQHRVIVELHPDKALGKKEEDDEKARISAFRASLSAAQVEKVVEDTEELKRLQETPDSPEMLACVPTLAIADIPRAVKTIPSDLSSLGATTLLTHDLFTNDILYAEHLLDLHAVPMELMPLVPLWCRAMQRMGTAKKSFVDFDQSMGATTGGFGLSPFASSIRGSDDVAAYLVLRGKSTAGQAGQLHELMAEMMLEAKLDDREVFKQLVLESRSGAESGVQSGGHSVAAGRLGAMDSAAGYVNELMGGLAQLEYLKVLAKRVETDWDGVVVDLERIRSAVVARANSVTNLTADAKTMDASMTAVNSFLSALPAVGAGAATAPWSPSELVLPPRNELITVPTQVNYVGKGANLYKAGYELHGSSYVVNKMLSTTWLWDRVRVSGGAYGGFSDFESHSGYFTYLSYRDPNLLKTLGNYDGTVDYLAGLTLGPDELTKAIIGTMGDLDSYQLPDSKGYTSLMRHLLKVTDVERQQRREEVLGTTLKDFKAFGEALEATRAPTANVCAVVSPEAAAAAVKERPDLNFTVINVM